MGLSENNTLQERIFQIIASEGNIDPSFLTLDTNLDDLDLSSVDKVMMFFELETQLQIELDQTKLHELHTMRSLIDFVDAAVRSQ